MLPIGGIQAVPGTLLSISIGFVRSHARPEVAGASAVIEMAAPLNTYVVLSQGSLPSSV